MKCYYYPSLIFKKKWCWFAKPHDIKNVDMVTFFDYQNSSVAGFKKRVGFTSVIDLNQSIDEIWNKMRKNYIRKQIKRGERNGVVVQLDNKIDCFKKIYIQFRKDKKLPKENIKVFSDNAIIFNGYFQDKPIATGAFIGDGKYMRALVLASVRLTGVDGRMRDIIGQANRMLVWQAIKWAKESHYRLFDLGGVNPNSSSSKDRNLLTFKEAFGGERINCYYYTKIYSKILKKIINIKNRL